MPRCFHQNSGPVPQLALAFRILVDFPARDGPTNYQREAVLLCEVIYFCNAFSRLRPKRGAQATRPEAKFRQLRERHFSKQIGDLSFGYGRSRPALWDEPIFDLQKVGAEEVEGLRSAGRL